MQTHTRGYFATEGKNPLKVHTDLWVFSFYCNAKEHAKDVRSSATSFNII